MKKGSFLLINIFIEIGLTCLVPFSKGHFFNVLELKLQSALLLALVFYFGNIVILDLSQTLKPYLIIQVAQNYRAISLNKFKNITKYLHIQAFPQRIQEDIRLYWQNKLTIISEYIISFGIILYLVISNYTQVKLIIASIIYSLVCIYLAYIFKSKLVQKEKAVQQEEAAFRINLSKLEFKGFKEAIVANLQAARIKLGFGTVTTLQKNLMLILPYIFFLPFYMNGTMSLGLLMQQATIFDLLVLNFTIVINMFPLVTQTIASKERIEELTK